MCTNKSFILVHGFSKTSLSKYAFFHYQRIYTHHLIQKNRKNLMFLLKNRTKTCHKTVFLPFTLFIQVITSCLRIKQIFLLKR